MEDIFTTTFGLIGLAIVLLLMFGVVEIRFLGDIPITECTSPK